MSRIKRVLTEREKMGALLKHTREFLRWTQREMAQRLGYENANYISMLESGSSKIPLTKIPQISRKYCLDNIYMVIMMRELYPEMWNLIKEIMQNVPELDAMVKEKKKEDEFCNVYERALKDLRIG
jgi:DNA-binding XRE family transcriptional regulator